MFGPARPSAGIGVVEVQELEVFLTISAVLERPSAGIGVVEVQKLEVFTISAVVVRPSAGIGVVEVQKLKVVCGFFWSELPGTGGSRVRFPPGPRAGFASCTEQLAQSNLHRATCTEQRAQSNLPGATCTEQLARSNLHGATCTEQLAQSSFLPRATCAEWSRGCDAFGPTAV